MAVDGYGIYVNYGPKTNPEDITQQMVRSCLIGEKRDYCLTEAGSIEEAFEQFYKIPGATVGGEELKHRAVYIDDTREILELPACERIHKNAEGEYICGEPDPESEGLNGEFGMCIFEGCDAPCGCIVDSYRLAVAGCKGKAKEFRGFRYIPLQKGLLAEAAA